MTEKLEASSRPLVEPSTETIIRAARQTSQPDAGADAAGVGGIYAHLASMWILRYRSYTHTSSTS